MITFNVDRIRIQLIWAKNYESFVWIQYCDMYIKPAKNKNGLSFDRETAPFGQSEIESNSHAPILMEFS